MRKNLPVQDVEIDLDESSNILSITDHQGKIKYINDDFIKFSGFSREELIGEDHNIVRHPDMPPAAFADLWAAMKSNRTWKGMVKNRCKDGSYYWVDAYAIPIRNGEQIRYQSVRQKAKPIYIERAKALYAKLNRGQKLPRFISIQQKLLGLMVLLPLLLATAQITMADVPISQAVLSSAAFGLVFSGLGYWVLSPLRRVLRMSRNISSDPVARYIYTGRQDEVGEVEFALQLLRSESAGLIGRIQANAKDFHHKSAAILDASQKARAETEKQFTQTDSVASAAKQMNSSIQLVAENALAAAQSAKEAQCQAQSGKQVVDVTQELLESFINEIQSVSSSISKAADDSNNISTILDVIKSVAEQTNLLALNAAIEAARAGEMGRGFAVVAEEVRTLANRTQDSTAQIEAMINALQTSTQDSVNMMDQGLNKANECMAKGQDAVQALDAIEAAINSINDMNQTISASVEQQSQVAKDIFNDVSQIRDASESNLALASESSAESEAIDTSASRLFRVSEFFWQRNRALGRSRAAE
ncbi:MAG: methyl-accepting chemotaxis protein [Cellvibrionaceae bacterium]|nr:methyl-accepting chemotaxis protein [Cellvibrionaceae bacterium]